MNSRVLIAALAFVLLPVVACGESCRRQSATLLGFEGEIELAMKAPVGGVGMGPAVFYVKGDRVRMELKLPSTSIVPSVVYITDTSKRVSYLVDEKAKTYLIVTAKVPSAADASSTGVAASKPRKTGTDVVAGHACTLYETTTPGMMTMRSESCMAEDLGSPMLGPVAELLGGGGPLQGFGGSGFPLRMRTYDGSGALVFSMEATRVDRKSEPDTLFEPPRGYVAVDAGIW